ncbi:hypothetical protein GXP67_24925 [Rhodocytophaga rosea]|uniref:Uncharacterized protein n=1 Tax=Rhodocytophaga rosea TaxID=2704465 RepID=A0A6C0GNP5_9BACT|nr:hypothetical protein [Rhodocytophaga rosea]QHT69659.1 hypothetical protein GXP67_24925 [Rhodocytophaga rosea]
MLIEKLIQPFSNKPFSQQREIVFHILDLLAEVSPANLQADLQDLRINMDFWKSAVFVTLDKMYTRVLWFNTAGIDAETMHQILSEKIEQISTPCPDHQY